jgi:hypothetical protein
MDLKEIVDFVKGWRDANKIVGNAALDNTQLTAFAKDLQSQVDAFSVKPQQVSWHEPDNNDPNARTSWKPEAAVIGYSGDVGDKRGYQVAAAMSRNGEGKVFYISDTPAGKLLNNPEFEKAVIAATGGADFLAGQKAALLLINGFDENNKRVEKYAVGKVLPLDDRVSQRMMGEASGDVRVLVPNALPERVFYKTELPALLDNPNVTAINRVPKEVLKEIYAKHSVDGVRTVLSVASCELMKNMKVGDIGDRIAVDACEFCKGTGITLQPMPRTATNVRSVGQQLAVQVPDLEQKRTKAAELIAEADKSIQVKTGRSALAPTIKAAGDAERIRRAMIRQTVGATKSAGLSLR